MTSSRPLEPPQPPPFVRKVRIPRTQAIGVGLLALLPIGALTGVFGTADQRVSERSGALELQARYPDRLRYQVSHALELQVRNIGATPVTTVTLRLPTAYLASFSEVQYVPRPERLTEDHAEIVLRDLQPGQTRRVVVQLRGDEYGRQQGRFTASTADGAPVEVALSTFVLP